MPLVAVCSNHPLTFQHSAFSHQLSHHSVIGECAGQCSLYIPRSRLNGLNQLSARKLGRLFCSLGKVSCLWQNEAVWCPFCHECLRNRHRTTLETIGQVLAYRIFVVCYRLVNKLEYHTFKRAANSLVMSRFERSLATSLTTCRRCILVSQPIHACTLSPTARLTPTRFNYHDQQQTPGSITLGNLKHSMQSLLSMDLEHLAHR